MINFTNFKRTCLQRLSTCIMLLPLCACSALQIDVDVYKGALANTEHVQLRQFAMQAIAAKPLIVALRNEAILKKLFKGSETKEEKERINALISCMKIDRTRAGGSKGLAQEAQEANEAKLAQEALKAFESMEAREAREAKEAKEAQKEVLQSEGYINCNFENPSAEFLNLTLFLYDDIIGARLKTRVSDAESLSLSRSAIGITKLTENYIDELANRTSDVTKNDQMVSENQIRLTEALIVFAERILFIVNNYDIADSKRLRAGAIKNLSDEFIVPLFEGDKNISFAQKMAVLQSLGNTIIVLGDDLRRHAQHSARAIERKQSELRALEQAQWLGAPQAFEKLLRELEGNLSYLKAAEAKSAKNGGAEKPEDIAAALLADTKKVLPALAAYRTIAADYDFALADILKMDGQALQDQQQIAKLFKKTGGKKSLNDVIKKLLSWFDDSKLQPPNVLASLPNQTVKPEFTRRADAKDYLSTLDQKKLIIGEDNEEAVFTKLKAALLEGIKSDTVALEKQQKRIGESAKIREGNDAVNNQIAIIEVIKRVKSAVLKSAEERTVVDLSGLGQVILSELEKSKTTTASDADKKKFDLALEAVKQITRSGTFYAIDGSASKTRTNVLDDYIALLQYKQLKATESGFAIDAENYRKALELAYVQKGGYAFLRPASTYLRSAYANTTIQDGDREKPNLLLPDSSLGGTGIYNRALNATKFEIDQQYWQTVNTVKVAGGGATDFAIAKDDVGNWYVKGLSSDPEKLFKSAQGLLLFNTGKKVSANLLAQVNDQRTLDTKPELGEAERMQIRTNMTNRQTNGDANTNALSKLQGNYQSKYMTATISDLDGLKKQLEALPGEFELAWKKIGFDDVAPANSPAVLGDMLKSKPEIDSAIKTLEMAQMSANDAKIAAANTPAVASAKADTANLTSTTAIADALKDVRGFRSRLSQAIIKNEVLIKAQQEAATKAKDDERKQAEKVKDLNDVIKAGEGDDQQAKEAAATATKNLPGENQKLITLKDTTREKENFVKVAEMNRSKAAEQLSLIINRLIEKVVASRLETIKTYETAVVFIVEAGAQE